MISIPLRAGRLTCQKNQNVPVFSSNVPSTLAPYRLAREAAQSPTALVWQDSTLSPALSEVAGVVSTARIERPPLYRGGSASKETIPATSPPSSQTARCTSTGNYQLALSIPSTSPRGVGRLSFTARIGRAQFHRARSASKKDGLPTPLIAETTTARRGIPTPRRIYTRRQPGG